MLSKKITSPTTENHSRTEKRKATFQRARTAKAARLSGAYSNNYRKILNLDIQDVTSQTVNEGHNPLYSSQVGMSIWASHEKNLFFIALGRLGGDDIEGIAGRIGSKSALEVRQYLLALRMGVVETNSHERRHGMLGYAEIHAAIQLSRECEAELEGAADALAFRQERYEEQVEEKKWGEIPWLLDSIANDQIEEFLLDDNERDKLVERLPSIELLHLGNFLELSNQIFMNPASPREDENWQFLIESDEEEPAIRTTAFQDFHQLVISVTKRLVASSIFCAMSRLRTTNAKLPVLQAADVQAAAKTIGMNLNSNKFWTECPRRCHLDIYRRKVTLQPMSYDEVEAHMGGKELKLLEPRTPKPEDEEEESDCPSTPVSDWDVPKYGCPFGGGTNNSGTVDYEVADDISPFLETVGFSDSDPQQPSDPGRAKQKSLHKEFLEDAHQKYAELVDMHASLPEEQKLWDALKRDPPTKIEIDDGKLTARPPLVKRKEIEELKDWRDKLRFRSHWETFGAPVLSHKFEAARTRDKERDGMEISASEYEYFDDMGEEGSDEEELWESFDNAAAVIDGEGSQTDMHV